MKYNITGSNMQCVNIELASGEEFSGVGGSMVYMSGNMRMESKMEGGLFSGVKRMMSGASLFLLKYRTEGGSGVLGLGGKVPGKIMDIDVSKGSWLVQNTGFLGAESTVKLDLAFQKKLSSAFFGGEGFMLQRLSGSGIAFINACGDFNVIDLKPGEMFKVSTSNAVAWEDTVKYDITAASGIKTALFGGEGLFVTTLTGPGKIVIQSMGMNDLAMSIYPYLPQPSN